MRRVPIRLRLTLAFALVMAVVLTGTGLFLYLRFRSDLDRTINQSLSTRTNDVASLLRQSDGEREGAGVLLPQQEEGFAQVVTPVGRVIDSTPAVSGASLLDRAQLAAASKDELMVDLNPVQKLDEPSRLRASPVTAGGRNLIIVVGSALDDRNDSLSSLRDLLLVGGPVALLLASLAGYGVAASALRPVEAMRRQAAEISATEPGRRLPVPPTGDEVARLGETLNEMLLRLEEAFQHQRTFVSDASHELRTPLAILKTELELAMRAGRTPEELELAIRSAAEETDRLAQLAEDLLVVARSDQGRLPVRLVNVEVADLLDSLRERFSERCAAQGRPIVAKPADKLIIRADPIRLEQAVANLIENGLRHGGGPITLSVRAERTNIEIHVSDEGTGFPPDFIEKAFDRFTRADPARTRGGSGLGLSIVDAVAEAHGGSAHVANGERGGADAWIVLPFEVTAADPPEVS
jgi:two-component system OmpR family sensor kinase